MTANIIIGRELPPRKLQKPKLSPQELIEFRLSCLRRGHITQKINGKTEKQKACLLAVQKRPKTKNQMLQFRRMTENYHGEGNPAAVLTESNVIAIRASTERSPVLAKKYGVCSQTIILIRRGQLWKHLLPIDMGNYQG